MSSEMLIVHLYMCNRKGVHNKQLVWNEKYRIYRRKEIICGCRRRYGNDKNENG